MLETELELEDGGYWRRNWSRRMEGTGDRTGNYSPYRCVRWYKHVQIASYCRVGYRK